MAAVTIETPLGLLVLEGDELGIQKVTFSDTPKEEFPIPEALAQGVVELKEYFQGTRTLFDVLLQPEGTDFQKRVWQQLSEIPFGKTKTYQAVANKLGNPKVIRAAASANGKNPIAIIIPCHRVIGSDGSLTGYAGGIHRKKWLLDHENPLKQGSLF